MAKSRQASVNMRKLPKQERSKFTIEAILDATAQLLETGSASTVTTNHIAKRAGISIGTLYQYFPNKTSVMTALADRGRASRAKDVVRHLEGLEAATIEESARQIIKTLISVIARTKADRQLTLLTMIQKLEEGPMEAAPVDEVAAFMASRIDTIMGGPGAQNAMKSFILTRAILGVVRSTIMDAPHLLKDREYEDQLVQLAIGFIKPN